MRVLSLILVVAVIALSAYISFTVAHNEDYSSYSYGGPTSAPVYPPPNPYDSNDHHHHHCDDPVVSAYVAVLIINSNVSQTDALNYWSEVVSVQIQNWGIRTSIRAGYTTNFYDLPPAITVAIFFHDERDLALATDPLLLRILDVPEFWFITATTRIENLQPRVCIPKLLSAFWLDVINLIEGQEDAAADYFTTTLAPLYDHPSYGAKVLATGGAGSEGGAGFFFAFSFFTQPLDEVFNNYSPYFENVIVPAYDAVNGTILEGLSVGLRVRVFDSSEGWGATALWYDRYPVDGNPSASVEAFFNSQVFPIYGPTRLAMGGITITDPSIYGLLQFYVVPAYKDAEDVDAWWDLNVLPVANSSTLIDGDNINSYSTEAVYPITVPVQGVVAAWVSYYAFNFADIDNGLLPYIKKELIPLFDFVAAAHGINMRTMAGLSTNSIQIIQLFYSLDDFNAWNNGGWYNTEVYPLLVNGGFLDMGQWLADALVFSGYSEATRPGVVGLLAAAQLSSSSSSNWSLSNSSQNKATTTSASSSSSASHGHRSRVA